jgi:alpha-ribazole phosphatase
MPYSLFKGRDMSHSYQNAAIDLMRHGAVTGDAGLYGRTDIALSESGWQQMQQAVNIDLQYQQIISSPLQRCRFFAEAYSEKHNLNLHIEPLLQEMNFGLWDGHSFDQLQHCWIDLEKFWQNPVQVIPPDGEALVDFYARTRAAWNGLLQICRGTQTLVVAHAGVIRMILAQLLHVDWQSAEFYQRLRIDYGSITRIHVLYTEDNVYPQIRFIGRPSPVI